MKKILIVDYQLSSCDLIRNFLVKKSYIVETSTHAEKALILIQKNRYDAIICDYRLPDLDGSEFFKKASIIQADAAYIFISKEVNLKNAVDLVRGGAFSYLAKPLNPDELLQVIREAISSRKDNHKKVQDNDTESFSKNINSHYVVGKSTLALEMIQQVKRVGPTNYSVIIEGETGTGKESLARMIHNESPRRSKPFIAIDCGSISKEISGSELFGHEKGAFTGAISKKTGFFELAEGGTIFLDEIANLSLETQMALLRALQEKVIRKIGGVNEIPVDVRIIAATNEDLRKKSESSGFRDDLFFRLSEFVLKVPALRNRLDDLPLFIDYFLENTAIELDRKKPQLSQQVREYFTTYHWPGNIRELKNVIRRACLFVAKDNIIYTDALPSSLLENLYFGELEERAVLEDHQYSKNRLKINESSDLKSTAIHAESKKIMEVLNKVHFNKTKAAEILNIHRKTLYTKLKMMNINY